MWHGAVLSLAAHFIYDLWGAVQAGISAGSPRGRLLEGGRSTRGPRRLIRGFLLTLCILGRFWIRRFWGNLSLIVIRQSQSRIFERLDAHSRWVRFPLHNQDYRVL